MGRILSAFAQNTIFANIVLVLILLAGAMAGLFMIREDIPEVSLDEITISVEYPGADPEEVEEGVSRKIEESIDGIEGIKQYTTRSLENVSFTEIKVKENYDAGEVLDRVRSELDAISTFPAGAENPIIFEQIHQEGLIGLCLSGIMSERRLKEWAEEVKDEIEAECDISRIDILGVRDYEINIEVSKERLREYGLTLSHVAEAVRRNNLNLAGGTIRTQGEDIRIRTIGRKYDAEKLASIAVLAKPDGEIIRLDRLATINDGFTDDPIRATTNGMPSALLTIYKTSEQDALKVSENVQSYVKKKQAQLPEGLNIEIIYDESDALRSRISMLIENGLIGLGLVLLILCLFLDMRLSFWVGMGIPISLGGALAFVWATGGTFNMISFFGLILVLGIVVDDAIVVGEAIFVHRMRGASPLQAAVDGCLEVGLPVTAAVTTTVLAFIPLAFVKGTMGNMIAIIPPVVISCLLISLFECLLILPAHLNHLPDPNAENKKQSILGSIVGALQRQISQGLEWLISHIYSPLLEAALQWRYVSVSAMICIMLLVIGMMQGGIVKFEPLPEFDGFIINSNIEFPNGTPVEVTRKAVNQVDQALLRLAEQTDTQSGAPLIIDRVAVVGQAMSSHGMGDMGDSGPHLGGLRAILLDSERRGIPSKDLLIAWEKETGTIPGVKSLTFEGMAEGPPGAPIEIWLQGKNMEHILSASKKLQSRLRQFEGVRQVRSDFSTGKNEISLRLKPEASTLGLTVEDMAGQVYAGYYGEEALRLQRGREDIRVKVRYTADERSRISDLEQIRIRTRNGHEIPLFSAADVNLGPGYSTITRTDGIRRVAISADVNSNIANAGEILEELSSDYFPQLEAYYPGLKISIQGEQEEFRESVGSLFFGFPLAIIGIFMIIATTFRSYAQPFVILTVVPFGIIGGILGHVLLGYDFSLMSIFGMVALAGVVVNDAIVLIERINKNLAEGMPFFEAIRQGGIRRFRPIFLTTISTAGALTPLIMEKSLQAQWLIPMAISLAAGVAFATVLTLLIIPSLLVILNDFRLLLHRLQNKAWPTREDVEPARFRNNEEPSSFAVSDIEIIQPHGADHRSG